MLDSTWEPFTEMEFFLLLAASDVIAQQLVRRAGQDFCGPIIAPPGAYCRALLASTLAVER